MDKLQVMRVFERLCPTIEYALDKNAAVILLSHLGRPQEGQFSAAFSLAPIAKKLEQLLHSRLNLFHNYLEGIKRCSW